MKRGRPLDNDIPILVYTQNFQEYTGEKYKWEWDLNKSRGPISVEITSLQYITSDKLVKEIDLLEKKYITKNGKRKPRMLKKDKELLEKLKQDLENEHYKFYPEDGGRKKK